MTRQIRNTKEIRSPKSETRGHRGPGACLRISAFGFRASFGFRISDFGIGLSFVIRDSSFTVWPGTVAPHANLAVCPAQTGRSRPHPGGSSVDLSRFGHPAH